jgi:hypothetical protein
VTRIGEWRAVYGVFVGKPEGKRPLGRPKHRWEIILKRIFKQWVRAAWTGLL